MSELVEVRQYSTAISSAAEQSLKADKENEDCVAQPSEGCLVS